MKRLYDMTRAEIDATIARVIQMRKQEKDKRIYRKKIAEKLDSVNRGN